MDQGWGHTNSHFRVHLGAFEATLVMLGSSPPSLSLLLGVIRGFGLSFGFQESA